MKKIFLILLLAGVVLSCEDEVTSQIPLAQVSVNLDLSFTDKVLTGAGSYKMFLHGFERYQSEHFGFGGIIVFNTGTQLVAYDLSCPEEAQSDIRVKPNSTEVEVQCPKCGATFGLFSGFPVSGSKFSLRAYPVSSTGNNTYIVSH